ncbi:hypothetical protein JIG36_02305 [Actinoplanes sp. LDG1-06]|uniref:Gluconate 2-dehydrogenase subunit 3 family protein n=1 Tax=Paractinoplanes ovalisporus TaxID=2810368 RepID=A0ABS2A521_9ACTN|nr:hypothetical protein [Actinoplanes ovalisporus]MBM2614389.1 hypothetical protein [Actinoplanes ovalisporus]
MFVIVSLPGRGERLTNRRPTAAHAQPASSRSYHPPSIGEALPGARGTWNSRSSDRLAAQNAKPPGRSSDDAVRLLWFRPISIPWAGAAVERFDGADDDHDVHRGRAVLEDIVDAIWSLPESAQLAELNAALIGKLKSSKLERTVLLEALGYAGALPAGGHPSYATEFVMFDEANRRMPSQFYKKEWAYPVRSWTGVDGVDPARLPTGE